MSAQFNRTHRVCQVGSAGLAGIAIALLVMLGYGVIWLIFPDWRPPQWFAWPATVAIVIVFPIYFRDTYRWCFYHCYQHRMKKKSV